MCGLKHAKCPRCRVIAKSKSFSCGRSARTLRFRAPGSEYLAELKSLDYGNSNRYLQAMKTLRGVTYLRDAAGRRTAVAIDLRRNRALWEDFVDVATPRGRAREPRESLAAVRSRLVCVGRLKRSA